MEIKKLHGKHHTNEFGSYTLESNQDLAIAISTGGKSNCHTSTDPNEDSVGFAVNDGRKLIIVTDAHFGERSARKVVDVVLNDSQLIFENTNSLKEFRSTVANLVFDVSSEVAKANETLDIEYQSRTQMSLAVASNNKIYWANFGDSRIYSDWKVDGSYNVAPVIHHRALGYPMTMEQFLENLSTGKLDFPSSQNLIICSDGFPEAKNPEAEPYTIVTNWIRNPSNPRSICKQLMETAFELGACDNLAVAVLSN